MNETIDAQIAQHEAAIDQLRQERANIDPTERYRRALEAIRGVAVPDGQESAMNAWVAVQRQMRMIANHALTPSIETAKEFTEATKP